MKIYNYYLKAFEYSILNATKGKIDEVLITEFKKAIIKINENWDEYNYLFKNGLDYLYSYEEKMVYSILAADSKLNILNKDPNFVTHLVWGLINTHKSPKNYHEYAKLLLSEPFYNEIINSKTNDYTYYFPIMCILENLDEPIVNEEKYNLIRRELSSYNDEVYSILIDENDCLYTIYLKIRNYMKNENKTIPIYTSLQFKTLKWLFYISEDKEDELMYDLLLIDEYCYTKRDIVRNVLNLLDKYKKNEIKLTRGKNE